MQQNQAQMKLKHQYFMKTPNLILPRSTTTLGECHIAQKVHFALSGQGFFKVSSNAHVDIPQIPKCYATLNIPNSSPIAKPPQHQPRYADEQPLEVSASLFCRKITNAKDARHKSSEYPCQHTLVKHVPRCFILSAIFSIC